MKPLGDRDTGKTEGAITRKRDPVSFSAWFSVIILMLVNVLSQGDRILIATLMPEIQAELLLSDAQVGWLTGIAFALFYSFASIPIAFLSDIWIRKHVIGISILVWSAMTAVGGLAANFSQIFSTRVGVGIGEAGASPAAMSLIANTFPVRVLPVALSLFASGAALGAVVGPVVGGALAMNYGWRQTLIFMLIPGLVLSAAVYFFVPEPPRSPREGSFSSDLMRSKGAVRNILCDRAFQSVVMSTALISFCMFGIIYWLPVYYSRQFGFNIGQIGMMFGLSYGISAAAGTVIGGLVCQKIGADRISLVLRFIATVSLCSMPIWFIAFQLSSWVLVLSLVAIAALFVNMISGPFGSVIQIVCAPDQRAMAAALAGLAVNVIGVGLGPLCVGLLSQALLADFGDDSLRTALKIFAFLLIIPCSYLFWITRKANRQSLDGCVFTPA